MVALGLIACALRRLAGEEKAATPVVAVEARTRSI
jgi:hypothetical protein